MFDNVFDIFKSKSKNDAMSYRSDDDKLSLNIVLYLVRMTHNDKIDWKVSDIENYLFEARLDDWVIFVGANPERKTLTPRLSNDYFAVIKNTNTNEFVRLTEQSAIGDLVSSVRSNLGLERKTDTAFLERFREFLDSKTDYEMPV